MNLQAAHTQWATRPDDQRFQTLMDLKVAVEGRQNRARTLDVNLANLKFSVPPTRRDITIAIGEEAAIPTHWAFGQLSSQLHAPASYLRTLPPDLAVQCLEYGVKKSFSAKQATLLLDTADNGERTTLRATTSDSYGRIWDLDVVKMVESIVHDTAGRFFNPKEWGGTPSSLYASDRDVFVFMIDGGSLVDGGGSATSCTAASLSGTAKSAPRRSAS